MRLILTFLIFCVSHSSITACATSRSGALAWADVDGPAAVEGLRVARSAQEWQALWAGMGKPVPAPFPARGGVGLAVFLGDRPGAGYAIELVGVDASSRRIRVTLRERPPAEAAGETPALTAPWISVLDSRVRSDADVDVTWIPT